jgi:hypothetical protein
LAGGTGLTLSTNTLSVDAAQTQITSVGTLGSLTVTGDLTVDTSTLKVDSTNNRVGILDATPAVSLDAGSATDAFFVPKGTTAQRPTGVDGYFRYNTDDAQFEGYADGEWGAIAGSGSGSAIEPQIFAGDGSTVNFTLTSAPTSENNLLVFIDGVFQAHDSYSVSGTTLTFSTAPANTRVVTVYHARSNVSGANMIVDTMTGDNSDTTLTLSVAPVSVNNVQVYFDGVYQNKANYSISGTTLTFSTAPATGVAVEAITHTQTTINEPANGTVTSAKLSGDLTTPGNLDVTGTATMDGLTVDGAAVVRAGNTLTLNRTDNATGGAMSYVAGTGFIFNDANGDGTSFNVGAANLLRINSSGNVGIGTSSPNIANFGKALTITDPAASNQIPAIELAFGSNTRGANIAVDNRASVKALAITAVASDLAMTFGTNNTERMRIDSSGNVLIGTTTSLGVGTTFTPQGSNGTLAVFNQNYGNGFASHQFRYNGAAVGSIVINTSSTAYNTSSDYRLKENVVTDWDATTRLKQLKPSRFNFIADADTTVDGFLAHEVQDIVPEAITGVKDEMQEEEYEVTPAVLDEDLNVVTEAVMGTREVPKYQGIDQSKLVPLLVKTIQELEARITTLENA